MLQCFVCAKNRLLPEPRCNLMPWDSSQLISICLKGIESLMLL